MKCYLFFGAQILRHDMRQTPTWDNRQPTRDLNFSIHGKLTMDHSKRKNVL